MNRPVNRSAASGHDPLKLDVAAFARDHAELRGDWPLDELPRLSDSQVEPEPDAADDANEASTPQVHWEALGLQTPVPGGAPQIWLALSAHVAMRLQCQRCLGPVPILVGTQRRLLFVHDEETAARLDEESEEDVLVLTRDLNLRELVEDELLLALPLVALHECCPEPPRLFFGEDDTPEGTRRNPFGVLASLRKGDPEKS